MQVTVCFTEKDFVPTFEKGMFHDFITIRLLNNTDILRYEWNG